MRHPRSHPYPRKSVSQASSPNQSKYDSSRNYSPRQSSSKYRSEKFDKTQCFACKSFGHTVTHCRLLPRILAVLQFHTKHGDKCSAILKQHIRNNTVDSKRVFVRMLQNMDVLSIDDDSDTYLEHDIIVNTITDNGIVDDDFVTDEE